MNGADEERKNQRDVGKGVGGEEEEERGGMQPTERTGGEGG